MILKYSLPANSLIIILIFLHLHGMTFPYGDRIENTTVTDDPRLSAPWVASIFKRNTDGRWKYHCGGTLIKSFVVITAASCVSSGIGNSDDILYHANYTELRIYVGLRYINKEYLPIYDEHTQFSEVSLIREHKPPQLHNASINFQIYESPANLAAILLNREFNFTNYIQPVSLAKHATSIWEASILRGKVGTVAGFNANPVAKSEHEFQLQITNLTTSISWHCSQEYTQHTTYFNIACGYFAGEITKTIPCFLEGAGLIGYIEESGYFGPSIPYLMSIYTANSATLRIRNKRRDPYPLSRIEKNTQCSQADMIYFTRLGEYFRWASSHDLCGPNMNQCQGGGCYKPNKICDGVADCVDKSDESKEVCKYQKTCDPVKEFQCESGVCVPDEKFCDGIMDCFADNSDESDEKKCFKKAANRSTSCKPIPETEGVVTTCTLHQHLGGTPIRNCSAEEVPALTTAQQSCKQFYTGQVQLITCQVNGNWSSTFLKCIPECGKSESPNPESASGIGKYAEWPWYAAIYKVDETGTEEFFCGGSLISTTVVLTAAHCVTENKTRTLLQKEKLRVVLGKLRRPYGDNENQHVQEKIIRYIFIHKDYGPKTFEADIALIIFNEPVNLTRSVRPICLPKDESVASRQFVDEIGTVVGFGVDETIKNSMALKVAQLKYLDREACERSHNKEYRLSWICGERNSSNAVCKGDSGGGFVFASEKGYGNKKYIIQGLVSHARDGGNCSNNLPEVFTKVTPFVPWISRITNDPEGPMPNEWYQINLKAPGNGLLTWSRERDKVNTKGNIYRVQIVTDGGALRKDYYKGKKYYDDSLWKFQKPEDNSEYFILKNKNLLDAILTWEEEETFASSTRKNVVLIDEKSQEQTDLKRNDSLWKLKMEPNPNSKYTYFKIYDGVSMDAGILTYLDEDNEKERKKGRNFLQMYSNENVKNDTKKDEEDYLWSLTTSHPTDNVIPYTNLFAGIWYQIRLKSGGLLTRSSNKIPKGGYHVQILRGDVFSDFSIGGKSYNDTLWMIMKSGKKEFYKLINHNLPNAAATFGNSPDLRKWMVLIDGRANAEEFKESSLWKISQEKDDYYNIFNGDKKSFKKNGVVTYSVDGGENYVQIVINGTFRDEWKHDPDYLWSFSEVSDSDIGQWYQNQLIMEMEAAVRRSYDEYIFLEGKRRCEERRYITN